MSDIQKITLQSPLPAWLSSICASPAPPKSSTIASSTDRQYALVHKAGELAGSADRSGCRHQDEDLGLTGSGAVARSGFARRLTAEGRSWARRSRVGSGGVQIGPK